MFFQQFAAYQDDPRPSVDDAPWLHTIRDHEGLELRIGDHVETPRTFYTHHGIYIGDDMIIHYSGFADGMSCGAIQVTHTGTFANGAIIKVVPHPDRRHTREHSVERACGRLGEDWYNLLVNNCEHFVHWCIEGDHTSPQVNTKVGWVANAATLALIARNDNLRKLTTETLQTIAGRTSDTLTGTTTTLVASTVSRTALTTSAGVATGVAVSTYGGAAATAALIGGGAAITTLAAPLAAGIAVCVGIGAIWDWLSD